MFCSSRRRKGRDARNFFTPYRWIRFKVTGDPLKPGEREKLEERIYPEMKTAPFNIGIRLNLLSILDKYGLSDDVEEIMENSDPRGKYLESVGEA